MKKKTGTKNKTTKTKSKKPKKVSKSRKKSNTDTQTYSGIVIVDDDLTVDKEAVLEERKAFLEEARSQEASSD